MSGSIDERVVSMRFDNAQFERGVRQTNESLTALKKNLDFSDSAGGFDKLQQSLDGVDFKAIEKNLDHLTKRFSLFGDFFHTKLEGYIDSAFDKLTRLPKQMISTLRNFTHQFKDSLQMSSGYRQYESLMDTTKIIVANDKNLGKNIDATITDEHEILKAKSQEVASYLKILNEYADQTIYNFGHMANAISKFAVAGIDTSKATGMVTGLMNVAALNGATAEEASNSMETMARVIQMGGLTTSRYYYTLQGQKILSDRVQSTLVKMAGADAKAAVQKYGFAESLNKKKWLTDDLLADYLNIMGMDLKGDVTNLYKYLGQWSDDTGFVNGKYSKEVLDELYAMNQEAYKAATEVTTFTKMVDTVVQSIQSGWSETWQNLIGNYAESKQFFTKMADFLSRLYGQTGKMRNDILDAYNKIFNPGDDEKDQEWSKSVLAQYGKQIANRQQVFDSLYNLLETIISIRDAIFGWDDDKAKNFGVAFGLALGRVRDAINAVSNFFSQLVPSRDQEYKRVLNSRGLALVDFFKNIVEGVKTAWSVVKTVFGSIGSFIGSLFGPKNSVETGGERFVNILTTINEKIRGFFTGIQNDIKEGRGIAGFFNNLVRALDPVASAFRRFFRVIFGGSEQINGVTETSEGFFPRLFRKIFGGEGVESSLIQKIGQGFVKLVDFFSKVIEKISIFFKSIVEKIRTSEKVKQVVDWVRQTFQKIGSFFSRVIANVKQNLTLQKIINFSKRIFDKIVNFFKTVVEKIRTSEKVKQVVDWVRQTFQKIGSFFSRVIANVKQNLTLQKIIDFSKRIFDKIVNFFTGLYQGIKNAGVIDSVRSFFTKVFDTLKEFFNGTKKVQEVAASSGFMGGGGGGGSSSSSSSGSVPPALTFLDRLKMFFEHVVAVFTNEVWPRVKPAVDFVWGTIKFVTDHVAALGAVVLGAVFIRKITQINNLIGEIAKGIPMLQKSMANALNAFASSQHSLIRPPQTPKEKEAFSKKIWALTGAILAITLSIKMLGSLPVNEFKQGVLAFIAISGMVIALMIASRMFLSTVEKSSNNKDQQKSYKRVTRQFAGIAAMLFACAGAVKILGKMSQQQLTQGTIAVAALSGLVMTMSVIIALIDKIKSPDGVKRDPFKGVAKILFGLVASIAVLALIPQNRIWSGVSVIGALTGIILGFDLLLRLLSKIKMGQGSHKILTSMSTSMILLATTMMILSKINMNRAGPAMQMLGGIMLMMVGVMFAFGLMSKRGADSKQNQKTLLGIAALIGAMALSVKILSAIKVGDMLKAELALGGLMLTLGLFLKMFGGTSQVKGSVGAFAGLTIAIVAMTSAIFLLSLIKPQEALAGAGAMALVMGALSLVFHGMKGLNSKAMLSSIAPIMSLLTVVIAVIAGLDIIKSIDLGTIIAFTAGITGILASFTIVLKTLKSNNGIKWSDIVGQFVPLLSLAGLMIAFAYSLSIAKDVKPTAILAFAVGMSAVMASFALCAHTLTQSEHSIKTGAAIMIMFIGFAAIMAAFGLAMSLVKDVKPETILAFSAGMSIAILSLTATAQILSKLSAGAVAKAGASLAILIGEMTLLVAGVGAIQAIFGDGTIQFFKNGASILGEVGTAIGNFFGNMMAGFNEGFHPFVDMVTELAQTDGLDKLASFLAGMSGVMLTLSAASIVDSLSHFVGGKGPLDVLAGFIAQMGGLGSQLRQYRKGIGDLDDNDFDAISRSAMAIQGIATALGNITWSSFLANIAGLFDDSGSVSIPGVMRDSRGAKTSGQKLADFIGVIVPLGTQLSGYTDQIRQLNLNDDDVEAFGRAAKAIGSIASGLGSMSLAEFGNNIAALFDGSRNANGSSKTPAEKLAEFLTLMGTMATDLVTAKGNLKGISNFSDVESASKAVISVAGALGAMSLTEGFNSLMTWSTNPLAGIIGGGPGNALKSFLGLISEVAEQLSTAYTSLKTAGINQSTLGVISAAASAVSMIAGALLTMTAARGLNELTTLATAILPVGATENLKSFLTSISTLGVQLAKFYDELTQKGLDSAKLDTLTSASKLAKAVAQAILVLSTAQFDAAIAYKAGGGSSASDGDFVERFKSFLTSISSLGSELVTYAEELEGVSYDNAVAVTTSLGTAITKILTQLADTNDKLKVNVGLFGFSIEGGDQDYLSRAIGYITDLKDKMHDYITTVGSIQTGDIDKASRTMELLRLFAASVYALNFTNLDSVGDAIGRLANKGLFKPLGGIFTEFQSVYDEAFVQKGLDEEKVHTMLTLFNLLATSAAEASEAYSNAEALTNKQGHGFETIFSLLATSVTQALRSLTEQEGTLASIVRSSFEVVGGYIVDGIVAGIKNRAALISEAVTGALEQLDPANLEATVAGITPVRDGTNYAAAYLGSDGLSADLAQRAASQIIVQEVNRYDDSRVVNAIYDLNRRVETLGSQMENLKVYINSGALVGAIGPDMNRYLGSVANRYMRLKD